ncbi:MAG: tyrosine-type recombinase/integrase [Verrucomicrobiota bacterium]
MNNINNTTKGNTQNVATSTEKGAPCLSTRQLLEKIPNYPCLYRHSVNNTYYAIKKHGGKRKEHSLDTTDRKSAERRLKDWIANLDKVDAQAEKTTLEQLLEKFIKGRLGKSKKTTDTERSIIKNFKATWGNGLGIQVSRVQPSMLNEWLAKQETRLKDSSYNRYALFLKQLFDLAYNDKMIPESPFSRVDKPWKRVEDVKRIVPTDEQFRAIVDNIRAEKRNVKAEESANFVEFLGLAGLGQAEARSLTWGDIDWIKEKISVRRRKTGALFYPPIYPQLKPFLQNLLAKETAKAAPQQTALPPNTPLFTISDARKSLTNACNRLGFPNFTQRSIRAYLIRKLWQKQVDIKLISKWQGHKDGGKLILNTYTEVFGTDDADYEKAQLAKIIL